LLSGEEVAMRVVALDVHKRFAEVAIHEDGRVRRLGRVETDQLKAFAQSLGPISRAGQAHARGLLIEAAHTAIRTPGPLRAFHARLKARRGPQVALCATARKLAVLAWHLLTSGQDYRYGAPTITQRKLRTLQRKAGDSGPMISLAGEAKRKTLEKRLLEEAERNYRTHVAQRASRKTGGAGAANGDATIQALKGQTMRDRPTSPTCSSRPGSPAPKEMIAPGT